MQADTVERDSYRISVAGTEFKIKMKRSILCVVIGPKQEIVIRGDCGQSGKAERYLPFVRIVKVVRYVQSPFSS